jgi:hypothetical protein
VRSHHRTAAVTAAQPAAAAEEAGTTLSAASAGKDTGVSLSHFASDGERFEPATYETTFRFRGHYQHVTLAEATATLWCANDRTGVIDLYSCVTGQFVTSLQPLSDEVTARQAELADLPSNTTAAISGKQVAGGGSKSSSSAMTPRSRGMVALAAGGAAASPSTRHRTGSWDRVPEKDVKPTCLHATAGQVWVGYSDGTVAVYDALLLKLVTMGQFHSTAVTALTVLLFTGQVVSASADGLLVLWDTEACGFEAVTRVTVLLDAVRGGAGTLCAMAATNTHATRVCCGFSSGAVYSVFVAHRPQEQTPAHLLKAHTSKVNAMAVVRELLFTAAEDSSVCVWYCGNAVAVAEPSVRGSHHGDWHVLASPPPLEAHMIRALHASTKLVKRVAVKPCVRGLLPEEATRSLWVAYGDGLLERWSANPDDDFGVEEVVHNALVSKSAETSNAPAEERSAVATAGAAAGEASVTALLSLSAVQTMQWLVLSSNGVNKVWYGHKNTLEMHLANSLMALHDVVAQDAADTAAWKEKVNLLKQKELERRTRYICILEQLNEQRVLQRHYERWKQAVLFCGVRRRRTAAVADTLERRSQVQLARSYFARWASFYDAQQRHMRRYVLSMALSRTTERLQLQKCFVAWQAFLVKRRVRRTAQVSATVLCAMVDSARRGAFFHRWRAAVSRSARRKAGVSSEHLALLAHKAQRQLQQRALQQWLSNHEERQRVNGLSAVAGSNTSATPTAEVSSHTGVSALSRFAAHYAHLQQQRLARQVLQMWCRWTVKKARYASLAAVAALREQQLLYDVRQAFFLRWRQRVHVRHTRDNAEQLKAIELKLRHAEEEHGDIFEKLQLQKQLDQLASRQAAEEAQLMQTRHQLAALEQSCAELRARQKERQTNDAGVLGTPFSLQQAAAAPGESDAGSHAALHEDPTSVGSWAAASQRNTSSVPRLPGMDIAVTGGCLSASLAGGGINNSVNSSGRGHMSANAVFYRSLVDQQRLSPIVLAHMPMEEAVNHVMGQLKGNVVNLFTDLLLFRQVKDRRRAGTSAVGILLEAFGELKRMIVSTVRGASATAASAAARSGVKATRWPLSMEALDCIPVHQCASVLSAIKTMVVAYDLLPPEDVPAVQSTCEEVVANADWVFLVARACYLRRKPLPPANNRQVVA